MDRPNGSDFSTQISIEETKISDAMAISCVAGVEHPALEMEEILVPPDGGYGYVVVFAASISMMVVDGVALSFGTLKDSILESMPESEQLDQATIAWVGSVLIGCYFFAGPFVSAMANMFGFRVVAVIGSTITSLAFICCWFMNQRGPDIALLVIFYGILGGIGFSCIYMAAVVVVGHYFEKKRALATGIAVCGSGVGNFLFPPLVSFMASRFHWQGAIFGLGVIVILCALLGLLYKPLKLQKIPKTTSSVSVEPTMNNGISHNITRNDKANKMESEPYNAEKESGCWFRKKCDGSKKIMDFSLWRSPTLITLGLSSMFTILGLLVPFVYLMDQARYELAVKGVMPDKHLQTLLISIIGAANTIGRIIAGWVADRPGVDALTLNNGAVMLMGISTALVPFLRHYYLFVMYSTAFGFGMACFISLRSILIIELLGLAKLTDAYGFVLLFEGLGATLSTPFAAFIVELSGETEDFSLAFYVAGGFILFSAFLYSRLTKIQSWEQQRQTITL